MEGVMDEASFSSFPIHYANAAGHPARP
jgi:hypothetical protein